MKKLKEKEYPIWIIHALYEKVFSSKQNIGSGVHKFTGTSFAYIVKFKYPCHEANSKMTDIEIHREAK